MVVFRRNKMLESPWFLVLLSFIDNAVAHILIIHKPEGAYEGYYFGFKSNDSKAISWNFSEFFMTNIYHQKRENSVAVPVLDNFVVTWHR